MWNHACSEFRYETRPLRKSSLVSVTSTAAALVELFLLLSYRTRGAKPFSAGDTLNYREIFPS